MKTLFNVTISAAIMLAATTTVQAQIPQERLKRDSLATPVQKASKEAMRKLADSLSEPYDYLQKLYRYHDPILYVTILPQFDAIKSRAIPLSDGEGNKGYWLEGNIAHRISLYRGKYYSRGFFKKLRATFDAGFMLRMTRDNSSPLLPTGNNVGLGADYLLSSINKVTKPGSVNYWIKAQLHHYSNGQAGSFFLNNTPGRNNYKNGDFSTNYFRIMAYALRQNANDHLFSAGLGYQREVEIGGPLTISDEMDHSYGFNRLLLTLQWVRASEYDLQQENNKPTVKTTRTQWSFRTEMNYILDGNLSSYPSTKKYRFGMHNYLTWMPWVTSDVGFVFHQYLGRDYLNIRYDDVVNTWQLGLVMNFNK